MTSEENSKVILEKINKEEKLDVSYEIAKNLYSWGIYATVRSHEEIAIQHQRLHEQEEVNKLHKLKVKEAEQWLESLPEKEKVCKIA
jgi:hypothetical protein